MVHLHRSRVALGRLIFHYQLERFFVPRKPLTDLKIQTNALSQVVLSICHNNDESLATSSRYGRTDFDPDSTVLTLPKAVDRVASQSKPISLSFYIRWVMDRNESVVSSMRGFF